MYDNLKDIDRNLADSLTDELAKRISEDLLLIKKDTNAIRVQVEKMDANSNKLLGQYSHVMGNLLCELEIRTIIHGNDQTKRKKNNTIVIEDTTEDEEKDNEEDKTDSSEREKETGRPAGKKKRGSQGNRKRGRR